MEHNAVKSLSAKVKNIVLMTFIHFGLVRCREIYSKYHERAILASVGYLEAQTHENTPQDKPTINHLIWNFFSSLGDQ